MYHRNHVSIHHINNYNLKISLLRFGAQLSIYSTD